MTVLWLRAGGSCKHKQSDKYAGLHQRAHNTLHFNQFNRLIYDMKAQYL